MIWSYSCGHGHAEVTPDHSMLSTFLTKLNASNSFAMCSLLDDIVSDSRKSNSKCRTCGARIFSLDLLFKHNNTWCIWSSVISYSNFALTPKNVVAPVVVTWILSIRCNFHFLVRCLIFGYLRTCPFGYERLQWSTWIRNTCWIKFNMLFYVLRVIFSSVSKKTENSLNIWLVILVMEPLLPTKSQIPSRYSLLL